jgi:hypothetical protein
MCIQQIPEVRFFIINFLSDPREGNNSLASPSLQGAVADMQPHHDFLLVDPDVFHHFIFHLWIF